MSDKTVPQEHQGLHGFLYGEGGAEAHDADAGYQMRQVCVIPQSRVCTELTSCPEHTDTYNGTAVAPRYPTIC